MKQSTKYKDARARNENLEYRSFSLSRKKKKNWLEKNTVML